MRSALALASLATMVMAAPLEMTKYQAYYGPYATYTPYSPAAEGAAAKMAATNMKRDPANNMAEDEHYTIYAGYRPYTSYDPYSAAAEAEAAKMGMSANKKRDMSMAQDEHYTVYAGYHPYSNYGPYSAAVDDAAANMQHAKRNMMAAEQMLHDATVAEQNMKRHMAMSMSKGMMNDDDAPVEEKRAEDVTHDAMMMTGDVVEKRDVPDNKVLPDNWYGHYDPYKTYGPYTAEVEAEGAKMMAKDEGVMA